MLASDFDRLIARVYVPTAREYGAPDSLGAIKRYAFTVLPTSHDPPATRYDGAPCSLYLPIGRADTVVVDSFAFPAFSGQLWAGRDIGAGEEIRITYTPLTAVARIERRALLARTCHFVCACPTCIVPAHQAEASNARRVGVCVLLERLQHTRFPLCVSQEELEQALEWTEEEEMVVERAKVLQGVWQPGAHRRL